MDSRADALEEVERRWHSAECYMGQAFNAETPGKFGYYNQRAWLEFNEAKRLMHALLLQANEMSGSA